MKVSTYGYKVPEDSDTNFWDYVEYNWNRLNSHSHDGVDSPHIPAKSVTRASATISGSWSASGSFYRTLVTMPTDYEFDNTNLTFLIGSEVIYPKVEKVSSNTFYVYTFDNTTVMTVYYG